MIPSRIKAASNPSHRVAHEAAHTAVAIKERVNIVEPVVGGDNGQETAAGPKRLEPVAMLEIRPAGQQKPNQPPKCISPGYLPPRIG
jgi:hypothetical protein